MIFELYRLFMYQNFLILPYCILLTRTKSISQIFKKISKNWFYFFFLISDKHQSTIFLDAMLQALILDLFFEVLYILHAQNIEVFGLTFWSCIKTAWLQR